jgi:hypothetical protein
MMIRTAFVAAFALFVVFVAPARAVSLDEGLNAYRDNHVAQAERIFSAIAADPHAGAEDRAGAQRELGRIAWLARGDAHPIASALVQAPSGQACETATLAARIFREAGNAGAMVTQAAQKLADCQGPLANDLRVELARDELAIASAKQRDTTLHAAEDYLSGIQGAGTRSPDASGARFSLAIMQRNANAALEAWQDYFWLTDSDVPQAMLSYRGHSHTVFTAGLAPNASAADRLALLTMMARAGFIDDARRLAAETNIARTAANDPAWRRLDALFHFDANVRSMTLAVNRRLMAGQHVTTYERDFRSATQRLMRDAGLQGDPQQALLDAFGLYGTIGETGGFPSLHAGYVVQDDRARVEQYGRSGDLRFIAIDHMLANGYQGWLWDGWAEAGGWAPDDATIVQVRSAYTRGPLNDLALSRPGPSRDRYLARIARQEPQERAALANNAVASLSATSARLNLQAVDAMAARAHGDDAAFIAEVWRATLQHSIFIHEGRHVLDKATFRGAQALSDEELEFRAKLSELALADYPRLALSNMSAVNVGDGTPHGNANARILTAYRDWMGAHVSEIAGYDAGAPALGQLDKLSDEQIRAVARALDPAAR